MRIYAKFKHTLTLLTVAKRICNIAENFMKTIMFFEVRKTSKEKSNMKIFFNGAAYKFIFCKDNTTTVAKVVNVNAISQYCFWNYQNQ